MTGVIVVLPKIDDARNMKNLLVRNGMPAAGVCTTGAQAIAQAEGLEEGIVLCSYKLRDMLYSGLRECLPDGFEMLVLASAHVIRDGLIEKDVICLSMPLKVHDLLSTLDMMIQVMERRKRKRKAKPRERSASEVKLISEAKEVLMSRNHLTEEEAYRYIQKCSMDSGTNMVETSQMILAMMKG